jgi:two-component system copper resistance phosphate regulon response regulator CusR
LLIVEDDPRLRGLVARGLEDSGYIVDVAGSAENALELLRFTEYAVLIVDWRLPGMSGLHLVKQVRAQAIDTAVLMLTARDAPADRIGGLDAGADDYLIKPFDFGELLARVRALQRRPGSSDGRVLRRGALQLDPQTRSVVAGGIGLHLTTTEFRILELLMLRAPAVVDRRQIAQHGWKDETDPIGSNAIDVRMARLRAKLAGSGTQILTVRGAGYRLAEG